MKKIAPSDKLRKELRALIDGLQDFESGEEDHLIIVRYAPSHTDDTEWVYNRADIPGAKVVWAREVDDAEQNRKLMEYFSDRQIWLLEPDTDPMQITPLALDRTRLTASPTE